MVGLRPIIEFMTWNFSAVAFDQILNNAAKLRQMSGGQFECPIVFRGPNASARQVGSQHSHAMEHFYAHVPGLKVVAPAFPADAKGLLKAAIRDDNPVLVMESETLYAIKGEVPDGEHVVALGKAQIARPGTDVTLAAYSRMTHVALEAAATLEKEGISAEVIDLRSLRPLDEDTLVASVERTHRLVVVHEGWPYGGVGAEIADRVQRLAFDALDAPILRVTTLDVPMPYSAQARARLHAAAGASGVDRPAGARAQRQLSLEAPRWRRFSRCRSCRPRWKRASYRHGTRRRATRSRSTTFSPRSRPTRPRWSFAPSTRGRLLKILVPAGLAGEARAAGRHRR